MPRSGLISITMGKTHGVNNGLTSALKGLNDQKSNSTPSGLQNWVLLYPRAYTHGYLNYTHSGY
jgi:hypothetical protein